METRIAGFMATIMREKAGVRKLEESPYFVVPAFHHGRRVIIIDGDL
jgi:hypothetical protein